ncbi:MAG TPA: hypothetical protein VL172_14190 [Kofleriaceae bacterium]|nr:hypothetical protein [Kofleriaceae bacterium]
MRSATLMLALLCAAPAPAAAQSKAWGAAVRLMLARDADASAIADTVEQVCGITAADSIDGITFNAADPRTGAASGVTIVKLAGVDEAQLRACAPRYAKATGKPVLLARGADGVTEVNHQGNRLWVVFVKPHTMAVAFDAADRPVLAAMAPRPPAPNSAPVPPPPPPPPARRTMHWIERRLHDLATLVALIQKTGADSFTAEITIDLDDVRDHLRSWF